MIFFSRITLRDNNELIATILRFDLSLFVVFLYISY